MTEEDTGRDQLHDERIAGEEAKRVLESELVQEVFAELDAALMAAFDQCPARDLEGLQGIKYQRLAIKALKTNLQTRVDTGKMAQLQIKELQEQDDREAAARA